MPAVEPQATAPRSLHEETLCGAFQVTAATRPEAVALRTAAGAVEWTFAYLEDRVRRIAAGLAALALQRGDTVAVMLTNRPEFHLVDLAAMHIGAVPFSVHPTTSAEDLAAVLDIAGSRVIVTEHGCLPTVHRAAGDRLDRVVLVDGGAEGTMPLAQVEDAADAAFDFGAAWRAVQPDDPIALVVTPGTSGLPKVVELTHRAVHAVDRGFAQALPTTAGGRTTSALSMADVTERWSRHYLALCCFGMTVTCLPDPRWVPAALPEARPTVWGAVPKLYEHVKWRLEAQGVTDPRSLPPHVRAGVRVRAGLDQCEWRIAYGSPMPVAVLEFFSALGLPILETYGLAEAAGVCAVGLGDRSGSGASGQALPGVGLRVDAAGGLSVRGPQVMRAYRGDPVLTAETLGLDGWLRTGDVADIDREGAVWILDRAEDLIIAATGARVSPTHVEAALRAAHPLIDHVAVIGDGRPYNVALVTLDAEVARALGERLLLLQDPTTAAVAAHPEVRRTVAAAVAEANAGLSAAERIERFGVLCDSWVPGGAHLTPAMKLRRRAIETTYAPQIEALYAVP